MTPAERAKALQQAIDGRRYCVRRLCIEATRHTQVDVPVPAELLTEALELSWEVALLAGSGGAS